MQSTHITLRTVPLVEAELHRLMAGVAALRQRVGRGDMEALEQLAELTAQVRQRLPQLRQFCRQNEEAEEEAEGVGFLEPLMARLTKMAEGPTVSKINEGYNEVPWKAVREKDAVKMAAASNRLSVSPRKESTPTRSRVIKESRAVVKKEVRAINQSASESRKREKSEIRKCQVMPKREQSRQDEEMEISFNNGAMFQGSDNLLTVRLSRQQYAEVLRLKKQQGHLH